MRELIYDSYSHCQMCCSFSLSPSNPGHPPSQVDTLEQQNSKLKHTGQQQKLLADSS